MSGFGIASEKVPTMKPVGADKKADVSPKKVRVLDETKI